MGISQAELRRLQGRPGCPTEREEQEALATWLDASALRWCHVPNERASRAEAGKLKRQGVKAGVPDVLVFSRVPGRPEVRGVAIELKRRRGGTVRETQREWIEGLRQSGWVAEVCRGSGDAIALLRRLFRLE